MLRLPPEDHPPAWFIPALALAVAVGTGLMEVPAALLRRELFALPIEGDEHLPWMAAAANIVIIFLPAALAWIIHRKWPTRWVEYVIVFVLFWTAAFALLRYIPRMNSWGMLVLAAGLGFQAAKAAMRDRARLHAFAGRAAISLSLLLLVYAAGAFAWAPLRERLANGRLGPAPAGAPDVLLLVLDTVRSASLGLYGYERATTPELERWARTGTVFEQAIATSSWTLPTHAGLFTGRYVHELKAGFRTPMGSRWPTVAEEFRRNGYSTAGFSANRKYVTWEFGLDRGFNRFEDYAVTPGQVMISSALSRMLVWQPWFQNLIGFHDLYGRKGADDIHVEFLRWVSGRRDQERPFFAFLNYYDAHNPYLSPPPWNGRFTGDTADYVPPTLGPWLNPEQIARERDAYEGAIAWLDFEISTLLEQLEARGLLSNTVLVITSDHGEQFGEHGMVDHGNSLYQPLLEVPLILRFPGAVPAGARIDMPVTLRDIPATMLDLAGLDGSAIPGESLVRFWDTTTAARDEPVSPILSGLTWPNGDDAHSLRQDNHVYIEWFGNRNELYDLEQDPAQLVNLLSSDSLAQAPYARRLHAITGTEPRPIELTPVQRFLTGTRR